MGGLAAGMRRRAVLVSALVASICVWLAAWASPAAPADDWTFVQVQRVNSLTLQFGTDTFATHNAFGGAFGSVAQSGMESALASSVADGSTSWLLEMPGLADLSGTSNGSFDVGVVDGTPVQSAGNPATYDRTSDLDWWYLPDDADLEPDGSASHQLTASFTARTFNAGPGPVTLDTNLGSQATTLAMSSAHIQAIAGDSSAPLKSTNGFPPGHQPGENLPDSLTSFESMSSGKLAGRISARSLANTPIPSNLSGSQCAEGYTASNTMLDLLITGCKVIIVTAVIATQPDTFDPAIGSGTYTFTKDASKHVTGCTHDGTTAVLDDCLDAAAYSSYFHFTTDRVIDRLQVNVGKLLTVNRAGSGSGGVTSSPAGIDCGVDCTEGYDPGAQVTLTANPSPGSRFGGWTGCDNPSGTTCEMTMDADKPVTASFVQQQTLTVSKDGSGTGSVTSSPAGIDCGADCSEDYDSGTRVTLTATAAAGSTFVGWSGGGCSGTSACTLTMDAAGTVQATFTADGSAGTGGAGDGGGATPAGGDRTTPAADRMPPAFGSATISPRKVRTRATVTFTLSEAAQVTFVFESVATGRRVGAACVEPTHANARKRRCDRFVPVARLTAAALAGANQKVFATRIGKRTLKPGSYRLTLRATDAVGNDSQPKRLTFVVVKPS